MDEKKKDEKITQKREKTLKSGQSYAGEKGGEQRPKEDQNSNKEVGRPKIRGKTLAKWPPRLTAG